MLNHIRYKHADVTESPAKAKQTAMTSFINSPRKTSPNQRENITQAIADMVVSDYLPLSIVEADGFRALMEIVAPDYEVPCRKTIRARIMKKFDDSKDSLRQDLETVSSASLTTDTWTSTSTDSYITVTEHHITDDWRMQSNVLITREMPERHTGVNLAARLHACVSEYGLDNKIEACVHDNARNMECAGDLCPEWTDNGCFAHTLQLCIKPALDLPQVEKTVSKCRKLVGHFKHSTILTAEMKKRQKVLDLPEHSLIQDVSTRWNSTQLMLERMCEQRRVVSDIMLDSKVTKKNDVHLLPSEREWEAMADISSVLKDLTTVTTFMSGENDVSCSYVYPIVCGLMNTSLKIESEDSSVTRKVKGSVSQQLQVRFKPLSTDSAATVPAVAALLDPRYKRLPFFSRNQRRAAEAELESRLDDIPLRLPSRETENPTPSKVPKTDSMPGFLQFTSPEKCTETDELKDYLLEKGGM